MHTNASLFFMVEIKTGILGITNNIQTFKKSLKSNVCVALPESLKKKCKYNIIHEHYMPISLISF